MTEPFWDELGIAWQATPAPEVPLERMKAHFRHASRQIGLAIWFAGLGGTFLAALGAFTVWQGSRQGALNFEIRGIAVLIVAAILWVMVGTLWPVRGGNARSLSEFAEIGLARAKRSRRELVMALAACAVAAVLGVIGTIVRTAADHPPAMSPLIDLAILALLAGIVEALRRRFRGEEARYAYLRDAVRSSD
jgi:hypothetical protein